MLIQMRQFWIVLRLRSAMVFFWDQGAVSYTHLTLPTTPYV